MAAKPPVPRTRWSIPQLEKYIRATSSDTTKILFLPHVNAQMRKRKITMDMALETLRRGKINLQPEIDNNTGDLKCRMEFYVAGKNVKLVIAISDTDPNLVLVTAI